MRNLLAPPVMVHRNIIQAELRWRANVVPNVDNTECAVVRNVIRHHRRLVIQMACQPQDLVASQ